MLLWQETFHQQHLDSHSSSTSLKTVCLPAACLPSLGLSYPLRKREPIGRISWVPSKCLAQWVSSVAPP